MSQLTTIAIAKTPFGEIRIESYGLYREASSEPLTLAEIGQIIEIALDDFSLEDVENVEGLDQGDIEYPHFLEMVMVFQAKLFQQKYQVLA